MGDSISSLNLEAGQLVGGYVLESRLGGGAMGSVWRVKDGAGTEFAMKILRDSLKEDSGTEQGHDQMTARERLRREAAALSRVRHPGVTSIVDMELDDALAFIVTELVEGKNLREDVEANGRYAGDDLERLAEKLIGAVKAVHAAGIIHRDIKPTNVMVSVTGPVLVDFGIAMGEGESHMTRTGQVMGTPGFIAPEVIDGAESDEMTDWWSVASVLAFAATGRPVFGTKPMMVVLERAASGRADLTGLPPRTLAALRAALAPNRAERCTPDELLEAIRRDAMESSYALENGTSHDAAAGTAGQFGQMPPVPLPPTPSAPKTFPTLAKQAPQTQDQDEPSPEGGVVRPFGASSSNGASDSAASLGTPPPGLPSPATSSPATSSPGLSSPGLPGFAQLPEEALIANPRLAWRMSASAPTVALPASAAPLGVLMPQAPETAETGVRVGRHAATASASPMSASPASESSMGPLPTSASPRDAIASPGHTSPTSTSPTSGSNTLATLALNTASAQAAMALEAESPGEITLPGGTAALPAAEATMPIGGDGEGMALGRSFDYGPMDDEPMDDDGPLPPAILPPDEAPETYAGHQRGARNAQPSEPAPVNPVQAAQRTQMRTARWLGASAVPVALAAVPVALMFAAVPTVAAIMTFALGWSMHTAGIAGRAQLQREERRGGVRKGRDRVVGAMGLPWYALRGLGYALPGVLLGLLVSVLIVAAGMLVLRPPTAALAVPLGAAVLQVPLPSGAPHDAGGWMLGVAGVLSWLGMVYAPGSVTLRMGLGMVWARRIAEDGSSGEIAEAIASQRTRTARLVAVTVAMVFAVATLTVLLVSGMIDWFPLVTT